MSISNARHERIEQEAADWLAALDSGRADLAAFERWRAGDAAHAIAFIQVENTWRQLDRLTRNPIAAAPAQAAPPEPHPMVSRRRALAAASIVVAVAAGSGVLIATQAAARTVETAVGERRRFYIADRACLDLNTASRLRWWTTDEGIEVQLMRGEVSLDLSPGAPHCTLDIGRARLRVEQGHCIVRLRPDDAVEMVAMTGRVHLLPLKGQARDTIIPAHAKLVVTAAGATTRPISETDIRAASAWQEGELLFDGEPLSVAVEQFNRYLPTPMVLDTPDIGRVRLGGRFLTNDPAEFLEALRVNFGIRAQPRQGKILLCR